jgi:NAD(P)-dependent dehydrogenase (short-subunit alcohol dehydrogenase family)
MEDLSGRVAVVTGAASGIGRALAERFAAEGALVVVADIDEPRLTAEAGRLRERGHKVLDVVTDVSSAAAVDHLAERTVDHFGRVDVLCNNAGTIAFGPAWELEQAEWERVVGINLMSVVHGIRSFVPAMRSSGDDGHIVNTASMAAFLDLGVVSPYATTKHAVVGLSLVLARDLELAESGIGVSVLCPGMVATPFVLPDADLSPDDEVPEGFVSAGAVADAVRRAIADRRFWVFTDDDDSRHQVEARFTQILAAFDT